MHLTQYATNACYLNKRNIKICLQTHLYFDQIHLHRKSVNVTCSRRSYVRKTFDGKYTYNTAKSLAWNPFDEAIDDSSNNSANDMSAEYVSSVQAGGHLHDSDPIVLRQLL